MLEKLFHITSKNVKCAICDAKAIREHEFQIQIFNDKLNEKVYGPILSISSTLLSFGGGSLFQSIISQNFILIPPIVLLVVILTCLFIFAYGVYNYILKKSLLRISLWEEYMDIKERNPQKGYIEIWNEIEKTHFPNQQYK